MNKIPEENLALIGMGRFGQFWARHLSRFYPVSCFDINKSRLKESEAFAEPDSLENCLRKPYIFLTMPIHTTRDFLQKNRKKFQDGTVIIDCASVKEIILEWFRTYIPEGVYYAASHPLFGPDSAYSGLKGHAVALMPGRIPFFHYRFLVNLLTKKLELTVLNMSASEHDRMMAYNLSLMHHIGRTFDSMKISRIPVVMSNLQKVKTMTEIVMRDSDELFEDFFQLNRYAGEICDDFISHFGEISARLVKRKNNKHNKKST
jgi:prephenate dehydrogenase